MVETSGAERVALLEDRQWHAAEADGADVAYLLHASRSNLSGLQAEDAFKHIESMRRLAGIDRPGHKFPNESTIIRFHHFLDQSQLTGPNFVEIRTS